jgi:hypothetical protein
MPETNLARPALLMVVLVIVIIGGWEIYLREKGVAIAYDDNGAMWSDKRAMVYEPADKADVFIGASRIKYDLDVDTWQRLTGRHAIQLALEGNSPMAFLEDLGNDPRFKGKLIVDVTEIAYFSDAPSFNTEPQGYVDYYKNQTPAQRASFLIDKAVESQFVFLDQQFLSLNAMLGNNLHIPNRPGFYSSGKPTFPIEFWRQQFSRQTKMAPGFLTDTVLQDKVTGVWSFFLDMGAKMPPPKVNPVPGIIQRTVVAVNKIREHGGEVVFVRPPSSDKFWTVEQAAFPRSKFWDPLVAATGCKGYFFTDYPGLSKFVPVEWSHLSPEGATGYTTELTRILPVSFTR